MENKTKRPNVVYVIADQLRRQSCGYAGDSLAQTPNIDRLAQESLSLTNAVSGHPVCSAYRASLFTGKYTPSTGMVINELRMNPNHRCIGHVLGDGGYQLGYIGKWHLWANEQGKHWKIENGFVPPGPNRLGFDQYWAAYNFNHKYYNGYYFRDTPEKIHVEGYEPDVQTDLAISYMREARESEQPFALFLALGTPHDPWEKDNVPEEYYRKFADIEFPLSPSYRDENDEYGDRWSDIPRTREGLQEWMRVYYAMAANLDWNIGRLTQALDDLGIAEDTILVFTSDHGELFGAHGRMKKNTFYEEAVRIPFLIRWNNHLAPGQSSDVCLNTVDIMPTLLGMVGLDAPSEVEGMDVSQRLLGQDGPEPEAALMMNTGPVAMWGDGVEWRALRDKRYTYAVYRRDGKEFLFDNQDDPYQLLNLADNSEHGQRIEAYRAQLRRRMEEIHDDFQACTWYQENWIEDRVIVRTATVNNA